MNDNKPIAYYCNCGTGGHQRGCSLHLRLLIKYGNKDQEIPGICVLRKCINVVPEEVENEIQYWYNQLLPQWVKEGRQTLKKNEIMWK